jgi:hypothetical protein
MKAVAVLGSAGFVGVMLTIGFGLGTVYAFRAVTSA